MIPSVVTTQLQSTIRDYLRTTFSLRDRSYEQALLAFLAHPEHGLFRGPYLDLRLPFRKSPTPPPPLAIAPPQTPYAHQLLAWQRLQSNTQAPQSTLIATGTGSGKTECFLYPLLDHCLRHHDRKGIHAIVLYPMNALASDQAERFARELHDHPALRGKVRAGLYVGGKGSHPVSDRLHLEDMKEHLRENPPHILLTNYRMLDFLLLRPEDSVLWSSTVSNHTLQYLVLDELHTYDGAQGTDVAFLIRRLKLRLGVDPGHLCCVGTSATIGGEDPRGRERLVAFAQDVFGERFEADSIVGEDRLSIREALPHPVDPELGDASTIPTDTLDPERFDGPRAYLEQQARSWLGAPPKGRPHWIAPDPHDPSQPLLDDEDGRVLLGAALERHQFLRDLLTAQTSREQRGPRHWQEVIDALPEDAHPWDPKLRKRRPLDWPLLSSFLALLSHARRREGDGVAPLFTLQLQIWLRELRRLLRTIPRTPDEPPTFAWHDALSSTPHAQHRRYGVQVYCRECGDVGLGLLQIEGRDDLVESPEKVGEAFLESSDTARYVRPGGTPDDEGKEGAGLFQHYLCPSSLHLTLRNEPIESEVDEDGVLRPIPLLPVSTHGDLSEGHKFLRRCPACGTDDGLTIMGSRAASLSSVAISHLYLSRYNSDPKLLAFTDSVQDASHRASFFAGRTYRFVMRTAIQAVLETHDDDVPMDRMVDAMLEHWTTQLEGPSRPPGALAATLLPPDLREDPDYVDYVSAIAEKRKPTKPQRQRVETLLRQRLSWEVVRELGLGLVIGRSLDRTSCATATPDSSALAAAGQSLHTWLHEHRPVAMAGAGPSTAEVTHYLEGLIERLRSRGGIHDRLLDAYVAKGNPFFLRRRKNPRISHFGRNARFPGFAFHGKAHRVFDPLLSPPTRLSWPRDWTARALHLQARDAGINDVLEQAMQRLATAGLVETRPTQGAAKTDPRASGLAPARLRITRRVDAVGCATCGHSRTVAADALARWVGARCTTYRCDGHYQPVTTADREHSYYRRIFKAGRIRRVFAAEHTGLLGRTAREALEGQFKRPDRPDAPNLLTCTPTLEMGIDIGDLSAVMLCTVPPLPANYVQRVGRAGRRTGNALVLVVANDRPHDRYFYEQPEQMMRGHIEPPACFLDAPDMLARQLVAHAMDSWAQQAQGQRIPRAMRDLLGPANTDGFPHSFYEFYDRRKFQIAGAFFDAFSRDPKHYPAWREVREVLDDLVIRGQIPGRIRAAFEGLDAERVELRKRRDALNRRKAELLADPGLAVPHAEEPDRSAEHEIADIDDAIKAYTSQLGALSSKYPLNVLTDAGVLPNYAFPEPGVTLRATLLGLRDDGDRKDGDTGSKGKGKGKDKDKPKGKKHRAEYLRPASAALREFAPFNHFYAEGHKIEITQLDLGTKQVPTVEQWRLCQSCHHAEPEVPGQQPVPSCPRCDDEHWHDQGRLRQLIQFRKAWSTTSVQEATAADESDEREQESYRVVSLVELDEAGVSHEARLIDTDELLFGYQLLPRAILREINFGRRRDTGLPATIAGESVEQPGFEVCRTCGRVQPHATAQGATREHLPWCKVKTAGLPEDTVRVGLYRQNTSEAIRVLLPVADHEVDGVVSSFRAALELGFRRKFGGQPMHLRVTTMSEPAGEARRRFLVIYDTVPGGTGYLSELWRQGQLFEVMRLAVEVMTRCPCVQNAERDGCYRCLYAHQHQRELRDISRSRAVELFERILAQRTHVRAVPSLSDVSTDSLMESELERRFVTALRAAAKQRKWRFDETVYGGRQGFRVVVDESLAWEVRLQVDVGPRDGVAHASRPDFVLVPVGRATRRIAVFTDGFAYHAKPNDARGVIAEDIRKRRALLDVSEHRPIGERWWVWSLTWSDLATELENKEGVKPLLGEVDAKSFAMLGKAIAPEGSGLRAPDRTLGGTESFAMLIRWLADPDEAHMQHSALTLGLAALDLQRPVDAAQVHGAAVALETKVGRDALIEPAASAKGTARARLLTRDTVALLLDAPAAALSKKVFSALQVRLRLYDEQADRRASGFEPAWRAFLQAWNLLQFHHVVVTSSERLLGDGEQPAAAAAAAAPTPASAPKAAPEPAPGFYMPAELLALVEDVREWEPLWRRLAEQELEAPGEPDGEGVVLDGHIVEVDYVWPEAQIALRDGLDDIDRRQLAKGGWLGFDPGIDDPVAIAAAVYERTR